MKIKFILALVLVSVQAAAQLDSAENFLDHYARTHNFSGTVLLVDKSANVFQKSFGLADIAFNVPNTPATRYKIASITKAFTTVLVLQLVEQGKIQLNQSISNYLPNYKGNGGTKVSIKQLLNMTSALRNMDENSSSLEVVLKNGIPQYQLPQTSEQLLSQYCSNDLVGIPGKEFDYNNANFIILGKIIETIYGRDFGTILREKILLPLGMENSGMLSQGEIIPKLANTYFYRDDYKKLVSDLPVYMENWFAAGAMYSNADDLLKFSNALFKGKLLKNSSLKEMFVSGEGEHGLGVWVYKDYQIGTKMYTIIKRPGSIMGAQAMLFHVREKGSTIIILANTTAVNMDDMAALLAKRLVH